MASWFKKHTKPLPDRFKAVAPTARLAEYRGTLPICQSVGVKHHLFCQRLDHKTAKALLAEGFRGTGAGSPTHVLFCVAYLGRDAGKARCLFNVCLALSEIPTPAGDWIARQVCSEIADSLKKATEYGYLIRCNSHREYPWCQEYEYLDQYWLIEISAYYRYYRKQALGKD